MLTGFPSAFPSSRLRFSKHTPCNRCSYPLIFFVALTALGQSTHHQLLMGKACSRCQSSQFCPSPHPFGPGVRFVPLGPGTRWPHQPGELQAFLLLLYSLPLSLALVSEILGLQDEGAPTPLDNGCGPLRSLVPWDTASRGIPSPSG